MKIHKNTQEWWGPPKKFSTEFEERKISWLELFYDLVYVITISRITHHLAEHLNWSGLLDYVYLFSMIFWGWLNGSLYHDIHGTSGLRTSLMTLWQIMIVAALVVTLNSPPETLLFNATIAFMVMQLFITYLWWSVGIYDKEHRKMNAPYTVLYLISFVLMFLTLFLETPYIRIIFYLSLLCNYLPPFIGYLLLKKQDTDFSLSSSMTERLGLFATIIFGEVVLGVVNGVSALKTLSWTIWLDFGLAILIVFSLWWLFFTLISDRLCQKGFLKSSLMELCYIPTLMSLGMIGVSFNGLFEGFEHNLQSSRLIGIVFSLSLSLFLLGIAVLMSFLEYPATYNKLKKITQRILTVAALIFICFTILNIHTALMPYFAEVLLVLLVIIVALNLSYYDLKQKQPLE